MILYEKRQTHDRPSRLVMYETGADGKCAPEYVTASFDGEIDSYYEQRWVELQRLRKQLTEGAISPVRLFMEYHHMTLKDVASRMRMPAFRVRRHLTPKGFGKVKVAVLQRYARLFDVAVADFFQFTCLPDGVEVGVERRSDRLLQDVTVGAAPDRETL